MTYLDTNILLTLMQGGRCYESLTGAIVSYDVLVETYVRYNLITKRETIKRAGEFGRAGVQAAARVFMAQLNAVVEENMLMLLEEDAFRRNMEVVVNCGLDYVDAVLLVQHSLGDVILTADTQMVHYMMSKDSVIRSHVESIRDGARVLGLSVDDVSAYRAYRSIPEVCKEQAVLAHKIYEEAHPL